MWQSAFLKKKKKFRWTSGQDGDIGYGVVGKHGWPLCTTTSKLLLKYRTTITQTIRNRVEWKPDNRRIKETTYIQTGRRGADAGWAGPNPYG